MLKLSFETNTSDGKHRLQDFIVFIVSDYFETRHFENFKDDDLIRNFQCLLQTIQFLHSFYEMNSFILTSKPPNSNE